MERGTTGRKPIQSFRDLEVYQRAQLMMGEVHRVVVQLPDHEKYGLVDQMRRSSKSVGALIAEGWALRHSEREFKHYLRRALGSANEMEAHLDTARVLGYLSEEVTSALTDGYRALDGKLVRLIANWKTYDSPSSIVHPPSSAARRGEASKDGEP